MTTHRRRPSLLACPIGLAVAAGLLCVPAHAVPQAVSSPVPDPAAGPTLPPIASGVLVVSVDGLTPRSIRHLGRDGTPTLHRLRRQGASTLDARTEREQTETLPNHTGMVTGRRIDAARGGHGVTWNDDRRDPATVQEAAGHEVGSVFGEVHQAGRSTALFASKTKLGLFERSWPRAVHRSTILLDNGRLVRRARRDIARRTRAFRFVHLSEPDVVGHAHGFRSRAYHRAVGRADELVGSLLRSLRRHDLAGDTVVVVTSDHGGIGDGHGDASTPANYRIPFLVAGPGVARGADLYAINPAYADPGRHRTTYAEDRQPVRNGAVGNLALDLLGLTGIPGSEHDVEQDLRVRPVGEG